LISLVYSEPTVPVDPQAYELISAIPRLERIALRHDHQERHDLSVLMNMPNLSYLDLYGMASDASELKGLEKLPKLTDLNLVGTGVGDEITSTLANCPILRAVAMNGVTDEGLLPLHRCKQLRFLNLRASDISPAALKQLRNALPLCNINVKGVEYKPLSEEPTSP
jgi:hypothetical protein